MRTRSVAACLAACQILAIGYAASASAQTTINLVSDRDNTMYQESVTSSNGAGAYLFAGPTLRGASERRALVRFDVAGSVPAGAHILEATLTLNCSRNNSETAFVYIHRLTSPWGEGVSDAGAPGGGGAAAAPNDATWNSNFFQSSDWTTPGGDFDELISALATMGSGLSGLGPVVWASTDPENGLMLSDVQSWLDTPDQNHGWIVIGSSLNGATAHRFDSRENTNPVVRPQLTIVYSTCLCNADFNCEGSVSVQDIFDFLAAWFSGADNADFNLSGEITVQDIFDFLAAWFVGC